MASRRSNVLPFEEPYKQILTMKVVLAGAKPSIWRRIQVPAAFTLGDLHYVIQIVMGWEDSHLHAFRVGQRSYSLPFEDDVDNGGDDADLVTLAVLGLSKLGAEFHYEYDFGDGWNHQITVETSTKRIRGNTYPRCLKAVRACPPEDCGGIFSYQRLLRILKNPKHSEHEDILDWLGEAFDPKSVNVEDINELLARGFSP